MSLIVQKKVTLAVVYGSKTEKINKLLTVVNEDIEIIHRGIIEKATDDEKEAFSNADLDLCDHACYTNAAECTEKELC